MVQDKGNFPHKGANRKGQQKGGGRDKPKGKGAGKETARPQALSGPEFCSSCDDGPICFGYNMGDCTATVCPRGFLHACARKGCNGPHRYNDPRCPLKPQ